MVTWHSCHSKVRVFLPQGANFHQNLSSGKKVMIWKVAKTSPWKVGLFYYGNEALHRPHRKNAVREGDFTPLPDP